MSELILLNNVSKSYGQKKVLDNVNFSVSEGQILGLVGPNGAGKTSCLQALLGLSKYEGEIDVLGFAPNKQRTKMLEKVAYISDVAVLPKWMTVSQCIEYVANVHTNFDQNKAMAFLAKTNILQQDKVKALSKGMVTQLHLALILAIDAQVLVLDEPTLGLDILTRRQFYTHLLEDFYTEDKCIIVTTHQIEEIEHILTNVAFIKDGKIALLESTETLTTRFRVLAVDNEHKENAQQLNPLYTNSMMGITSMLIDTSTLPSDCDLPAYGKVQSPTLADIFVGTMTNGDSQ
jgi:ABC-2 type transport system ATP-binding protein